MMSTLKAPRSKMSSFSRSTAKPKESKPGPMFALVAGTVIL
jgi:hypothetical protein